MDKVTEKIRTRDDGLLEGVHGPCGGAHDRASIAGRMGWQDGGRAAEVITKTLALLREGKAVKLTSHFGWRVFQPLAPDEDGSLIPRSRDTVYDPDGNVLERVVR
jgi:hypothetical protein